MRHQLKKVIWVPAPSGRTTGNLSAWKRTMDSISNPRKGSVYATSNKVGYEYLGTHRYNGDRVWRRVAQETLRPVTARDF